jgi:hypothetical protein
VGQDAIDAVDNFFRNTWNAQRTQLPSVGRLHPDGLAQVASFCRPLMVPAAMSHVPSQPRSAESQAFHPAYLLAYAPTGHAPAAAGVHDANGNGGAMLSCKSSQSSFVHPLAVLGWCIEIKQVKRTMCFQNG